MIKVRIYWREIGTLKYCMEVGVVQCWARAGYGGLLALR